MYNLCRKWQDSSQSVRRAAQDLDYQHAALVQPGDSIKAQICRGFSRGVFVIGQHAMFDRV